MFFSIIVTYNPDYEHVNSMCLALKERGLKVILYDNTPEPESLSNLKQHIDNEDIFFLGNGDNKGLSTAYTEAIKFIENKYKKSDIEAFLFYDQDSTILPKNVEELIEEYHFLKENKTPLGVLGARPINDKGKFYGVHKIKEQKYFPDKFIEVEFVISSFSLVPYATIEKVGYFDEKLFIDLVDSEFSFRCAKNGLVNLMSRKVIFTHEVGERKGTLLGLKSFAISSPIRNYYQARNLILVGRDYKWNMFIIMKLSKRFIQVLLSAYYSGDLIQRLHYFFKGIKDGINYKGGRIE